MSAMTRTTKRVAMAYYLPMLMAICSNVFYHVFLKMIDHDANPFLALCVTYIVAATASFLIYFSIYDRQSLGGDLLRLNWPCFALGLAIVFLEVGFILAYRAGWPIGAAAIFSNAAIGIFLIPIGVILFKEYISAMKLAGVALCVFGLILINK